MASDEGFLRAIREKPDDDAPRLIYADWLEERGDSRGKFIVVQCELARLDSSRSADGWVVEEWREESRDQPGQFLHVVRRRPRQERDNQRYTELQVHERELLKRYEEEWLAPLSGLGCDWRFGRGFVTAGTVAAGRLEEAAAPLLALAPLVRELRVSGVRECLKKVMGSPLASRVRVLRFSGENLDDGHLMDIWGVGGWPWFCQLEELDLSHNRFNLDPELFYEGDFDPLDELDTGLALPLRALNLSHNEIGPGGARRLAHVRNLASLQRLDLSGNVLGGDGAVAFFDSNTLTALTSLSLESNGIGDEVGELQVADRDSEGHILRVGRPDTDWAYFKSPLWRGLMGSSLFSGLTLLDLSRNRIRSIQDLYCHNSTDPRDELLPGEEPWPEEWSGPVVMLPQMLDLRHNLYDMEEAKHLLWRNKDRGWMKGIALSWAEPSAAAGRPRQ